MEVILDKALKWSECLYLTQNNFTILIFEVALISKLSLMLKIQFSSFSIKINKTDISIITTSGLKMNSNPYCRIHFCDRNVVPMTQNLLM